MMKCEWILCPVCGSKTRNKIRKDTVLENYPLYCPKCRQERLIKVAAVVIASVQMNWKSRNRLRENPDAGINRRHLHGRPFCHGFSRGCAAE